MKNAKIASRRDNFFRTIMFGAIFLCVIPMWLIYKQNGLTVYFVISGSIIMAVAGLLLWVWHHTYYSITETHLQYYSGPFKGKIAISKIESMAINKTSYAGLKYGLARNGIIVKSTTHMTLYITPKDPKTFIDVLLAKNSNIKLTT